MPNIRASHGYRDSKPSPATEEKAKDVLTAVRSLIHDVADGCSGPSAPWMLHTPHHGLTSSLERRFTAPRLLRSTELQTPRHAKEAFKGGNRGAQLWRKILGFNPFSQSCLVNGNACSLKKNRKKKSSREQALEQRLLTPGSWICLISIH